ncbi:hypothetical protein [Rhodanobacter lindaniclasticus]
MSLYNGSLSFAQADVSLPGNGPVLQVSRSFRPVDKKESGTVDGGFADWDLADCSKGRWRSNEQARKERFIWTADS